MPAEVTSAVPRSVNPPDGAAERLIKSADRVRDLGRSSRPAGSSTTCSTFFLTGGRFPQKTLLEPACGDGNFIVAILERETLDAGGREGVESGALPAGDTAEALHFHSLAALSSLYGVDISADNVVGATLEHPLGARARTVDALGWLPGDHWPERHVSGRASCSVRYGLPSANIVVADMVLRKCQRRRRPRPSTFQLVEYEGTPPTAE